VLALLVPPQAELNLSRELAVRARNYLGGVHPFDVRIETTSVTTRKATFFTKKNMSCVPSFLVVLDATVCKANVVAFVTGISYAFVNRLYVLLEQVGIHSLVAAFVADEPNSLVLSLLVKLKLSQKLCRVRTSVANKPVVFVLHCEMILHEIVGLERLIAPFTFTRYHCVSVVVENVSL